MALPNFLIIGAAKCGTTALHEYLGQHPEIFMSTPKELKFFPWENQKPSYQGPGDEGDAATILTSVDRYSSYFAQAGRYAARGESSPQYIYFSRAAERIHHHIPEAKLIAVLRHPVDRAYSHYLMVRREGYETLSFAEALAAEDQRIEHGWGYHWHYRRRGFYAAQLKPYFERFRRDQIQVHLYDDFVRDPIALTQAIFRFLNVDDRFVPDVSRRHNESTTPRFHALQPYLMQPRRSKTRIKALLPRRLSRHIADGLRRWNLTKAVVPDDLRAEWTDVYRDDILQLQEMLQRDLSHWLH